MIKNSTHKANRQSYFAFSMVEVIVAVALVGGVLAMIAGAIFILDRKVANERIVVLPPALVADTGLTASTANGDTPWGYPIALSGQTAAARPNFVLAPSRLADARAEALWRQISNIYEQSLTVAVINDYVIHNFVNPIVGGVGGPYFIGFNGYLSTPTNPITRDQILSPTSLLAELRNRSTINAGYNFKTWTLPSNVEPSSYRAATIFFLASGNTDSTNPNRILGILRMRAWQFTGTSSPYRFYEVSLARLRWERAGTPPNENWNLAGVGGPNFIEDFSYSFVEDKRFPQSLIFPPRDAEVGVGVQNHTTTTWLSQTDANARNLFVRLATRDEDYTPTGGNLSANDNPGVSRLQVSLTPVAASTWGLRAASEEWHIILPDPGLSQAEARARLRIGSGQPNFSATIDAAIRRQGKYGCVFKVFR